jgi:hypothetical protein
MPPLSLRFRSGWLRLSLLLTLFWSLAVLGTASWEYLTKNPFDYFDNKREGLFFTWVQDLLSKAQSGDETANLYFRLKTNALLSVLIGPLVALWLSALFIIPSFRWVRAGFAADAQSKYLLEGRLADVLALIQVLAIDDRTHRTEVGLLSELQGAPKSTSKWTAVATEHPEFFRVKHEGKYPVSLVARHVAPEDENGQPPISLEYMLRLLQTAVELHDRQVRRNQWWHVLVPLLVAFVAGAISIFGISKT